MRSDRLGGRWKDYHGQSEALLVEVGIVHQTASQAGNDESKEELEATDNQHPHGRLEHMHSAIAVGFGSHFDTVCRPNTNTC